jgi:uncharacterized protein YjlB
MRGLPCSSGRRPRHSDFNFKGDVLLIPAGVAHKNVGASIDFKCVGAYPGGKEFDINLGKSR